MAGMLTAAEARQQVSDAHDKYMGGAYVPGLSGGAYEDHLARMASAYTAPTAVTNAQLATNLNKTGAYDASGNLVGWVYAGGNIVTVAANRAGVDLNPEDAQNTEDLEMEVLVEDASTTFDANAESNLFHRGGNVPHPSAFYEDVDSLSPYVDPMFLVEASKQRGEKFF